MYVTYLLVLRRESFFRFNRVVLLAVMVLSLVLPLLRFRMPQSVGKPVSAIVLPAYEVLAQPATTRVGDVAARASWDWQTGLATLYVFGLAFTLLYKGVQLWSLRRAMRHGVLWVDRRHGHSWDILLLGVVQAVQWFNPFAWLLGGSLRDVHEYEADHCVLSSGVEMRGYQQLLLCKAVAGTQYEFANAFNHSLLTKRFKKMMQKKSNPWMRAKALAVGMFAVMAVGVCAAVKNVTDGQFLAAQPDEKQVCENPDVMPKFKEGELMAYLARNLRYPQEAREWGVGKELIAEFIVNADGSVSDVKVKDRAYLGKSNVLMKQVGVTAYGNKVDAKNLTPEQKKAVEDAYKSIDKEAVRVVLLTSGRWLPAQKSGKPVSIKYSLPLTFNLN